MQVDLFFYREPEEAKQLEEEEAAPAQDACMYACKPFRIPAVEISEL